MLSWVTTVRTAAACRFRAVSGGRRRIAGAACRVRNVACRAVGDRCRRLAAVAIGSARCGKCCGLRIRRVAQARGAVPLLPPVAGRSVASALRRSRAIGGGNAHRTDRRSCCRHGSDRKPRVEPAGRRVGRSLPLARRPICSILEARTGDLQDFRHARCSMVASRHSSRRFGRCCVMRAAYASTMRWGWLGSG